MSRKLSQAELQALGKRAGVKVQYPEKEDDREESVEVTIPKDMLEPLLKVAERIAAIQEEAGREASDKLDKVSDRLEEMAKAVAGVALATTGLPKAKQCARMPLCAVILYGKSTTSAADSS